MDAIGEPFPAPPDPVRGRGHFGVLALAVAAPVFLVVARLWLVPDARGVGTHEQLGMPACNLMRWTGVPCPGCGVTTSVTMAAQGHLAQSFANQPFGVLVFALLVAALPWALWVHLRGGDLWAAAQGFFRGRTLAALLVLMGAAWAYKLSRVFA